MASLGVHSFTFGYYFDSTTLKRLSGKDILYLSSIYANDATNKASSKVLFEQTIGSINTPQNIDDINGIFKAQRKSLPWQRAIVVRNMKINREVSILFSLLAQFEVTDK